MHKKKVRALLLAMTMAAGTVPVTAYADDSAEIETEDPSLDLTEEEDPEEESSEPETEESSEPEMEESSEEDSAEEPAEEMTDEEESAKEETKDVVTEKEFVSDEYTDDTADDETGSLEEEEASAVSGETEEAAESDADETPADAEEDGAEEEPADADAAVEDEEILDDASDSLEEPVAEEAALFAAAAPETEEAAEEEVELPETAGEESDAVKETIYFLNEYREGDMTIEGNKEYQITLPDGVEGTPVYQVVSGITAQVSSDGLVTPKPTVWYDHGGGFWTTTYKAGAKTMTEYTDGTTTIRVTCGDYTQDYKITVANYAEEYTEKKITEVTEDVRDEDLTDVDQAEAIVKYVAENYGYSVSESDAEGMLVTGAGDCWASTDLVNQISEKLGLIARVRNSRNIPGAGTGHVNTIFHIDGKYYVGDAGMYQEKPRSYRFYEEEDGLMLVGGDTLAQYDGFDEDVVVPNNVTTVRSYFTQNRMETTVFGRNNWSVVKTVTIPEETIAISPRAFDDCPDLVSIEIAEDNPIYSSIDGSLYNKAGTTLLRVPNNKNLASPADGTEVIAAYAYYQNSEITDVVIPDSVEALGDAVFARTDGPTVTIPRSVTEIGANLFEEVLFPDRVLLRVYEGSYAHQYAEENGINYELIQEPVTVTFVSKDQTVETKEVIKGETLEELPSLTSTEDETFEGWVDENGNPVDPSAPITEDVTYQAVWTEAAKYITVRFDDGNGNISESQIERGTAVGMLPIPSEMEGYTFKGWYTEPNGGTEITPDTKLSSDTSVYGVWEKNPVVEKKAVFIVNGETSEYVFQDGDSVGTAPAPGSEYGEFLGWATSPDGEPLAYETGLQETTYYAIFAVPEIDEEIAFLTWVEGETSENFAEKDAAVGDIPAPSVPDGKEFVGWALTKESDDILPADTPIEETTYYAIVKSTVPEKTTYLVVFEGTDERSVEVEEGKPIGAFPEAPAKEGYHFVGWADEGDAPVTEETKVFNDMRVSPVYEANEITVILRDGEDAEAITVNAETAEEDLAIMAAGLEKSGFSFEGWNTKEDGSGDYILTDAIADMVKTANDQVVELFAQWQRVNRTSTVVLEGMTGRAESSEDGNKTFTRRVTVKLVNKESGDTFVKTTTGNRTEMSEIPYGVYQMFVSIEESGSEVSDDGAKSFIARSDEKDMGELVINSRITRTGLEDLPDVHSDGQTEDPQDPVTPGEPEDPKDPEDPGNPENPEDPDNPEDPEEPENPGHDEPKEDDTDTDHKDPEDSKKDDQTSSTGTTDQKDSKGAKDDSDGAKKSESGKSSTSSSKGETKSADTSVKKNEGAVQTGDMGELPSYVGLMTASLAAMGIALKGRRKKDD